MIQDIEKYQINPYQVIFMKDSFFNRVYNFIYRHKFAFGTYIYTRCQYMKCYFQSVKIGKACKFKGPSNFLVGNGGHIEIGEKCIFTSYETLNRIGLNHRCIITASPVSDQETCLLKIGNDCGFSATSIWCFKEIIIGNNVRCGANTLIMDGDAHFEDPRTSPPKTIVIEDNVFLGANVVVKKGVTIGKNSVIGMNSVVTRDIPENCIAVGNPCKVIKRITL